MGYQKYIILIGCGAYRPRHTHAEVVGVPVLADAAVPLERAAHLGEEAATTQA